jgi:chaperonin GroES
MKEKFNLEALFDAVIVKPIEPEEQTYGSIVVPDLGKDKNEQGEVVASGPGKYTVTGTFLANSVVPGDVVILPTMGFTKLEYEGEEYLIGPENSILAKINK